jgi:large subunit ribosomal protein L20
MRTTFSVPSRKRRRRALKQAKGFRGARSKNIRTVYDALDKAKAHAYVGRKQKKRQYRRLWTVRINAACRMQEINYSTFMHGLKLADIEINRKMLSEMAIHDEVAFAALVTKAKEALAK